MLLWSVLYKFLYGHAFTSHGYLSRSGIAGSYSNSMFNFLRNLRTAFHSSHIILYSNHQSMKVPISFHPRHHLLFSFFFFFLIVAILMVVRWFWFTFPPWPMLWSIFLYVYWLFVWFVFLNIKSSLQAWDKLNLVMRCISKEF